MSEMNYNIDYYNMHCMKGVNMDLQAILEPYQHCKEYNLSEDVNSYLHYVKTKPFYVSPVFTDIHTTFGTTAKSPKFLIFSAPGATGKTTLAKYISSSYNALFWDLSKFRIGTNSFSGCILKAIGPQQYSNFIDDLESGDVLLILDAADEAEMLSGRTMLADFMLDINSNVTNSAVPCVMIFARTDTAQFLASLFTQNDISFYRYEIGLFEEAQSKEFMYKSINAATQPDLDCVDIFYNEIRKLIPNDAFKAFIGYAPVLEVISEYIKENKNRAKLLSSLREGMDCTDLILAVMHKILARERDEKVIAGFRRRIETKYPSFTSFDNLYSDEEQLVLVVNYMLFGEVDCDSYDNNLPYEIKVEYDSVVKSMLPQHPFIRNTEAEGEIFAGPAFKDFSLAVLLLSRRHSTCADLYLENKECRYMPSQIFLDCYLKISQDKVYSSHISHLYNSFRARASGTEQACITCCETDPVGHTGVVSFRNLLSDGTYRNYTDNLDLIFDSQTLHFDQVSNSAVLVPTCTLTLGSSNSVLQIYNSKIICEELVWEASDVSIESRKKLCLIVSLKNAKGTVNSFKIDADNLKISIPNISAYYRLYPYKCSMNIKASLDIDTFVYSLCAILREFRTHGKDTLAKTAERIDNVVVGQNELRADILEFLVVNEIMYREGHLYKINLSALKSYGISYTSILSMQVDHFYNIYNDFSKYDPKGQSFSISEKTSHFSSVK